MAPLQRWWAAQARSRQMWVAAGGGVALIVLVVAASFVFRRPQPSSAVVLATPTATLPPITATAVSSATPAPTETGIPTITSLKDLKQRFGDPPDARRGRFRIPQIGVDAPLGVRAVQPPGLVMHAPTGPADVVLYDFSADPRFGGSPGSGGNAIFSGHVDYSYKLPYANANYHGKGVFWDIRLLQPGDTIEVAVDGVTLRYAVQWRRVVSAANADWAQLLAHDVGGDAITLITCDGDFTPATQEYNSRTVVRATRT